MANSEPIRIVIADDHAVVRAGLRALMANKPEIELVGEAQNGRQAVLKTQTLNPDVLLLDMVMPDIDGLEVIKEIKQHNPQVRILVLTTFDDDERVIRAIKAGALGYLLKDSLPQQLLEAIRDVYQGRSSLHPTIALKLVRELGRPTTETPLTEREAEVLKLVAQGLEGKQIAQELAISSWTVRSHIRNILGKLHLANRTQAALYAQRTGLTDQETTD